MYLRILKRDLKRKKTMNVILLTFVILAATFIASSVNNLLTVNNALDGFLDKANAPDYWFCSTNAADIERFGAFAEENGYDHDVTRMTIIKQENILVEGEPFAYSNTTCLSALGGIRIFDKNNEEITHVNDGEVWVTNFIFRSADNDFHEGGKIRISQNGVEKEFTIKGYTKDALFGTAMVGMTRFLVSENDAKLFESEENVVCRFVGVYTKDADFLDKFTGLEVNTVLAINRAGFKMVYLMDVLIAAVLLVVSVCLILISMVILRFIILFTITEEFREIGVMQAIGIGTPAIRGLYTAKYLALALVGAAVGFGLSFPFGQVMLGSISQKIILSGEGHFLVNAVAAALVSVAVVSFGYFCTRKIRKFSPIKAIHSGETGERFREKGCLHLGKSRLPAVPFLAMNDVLSGVRTYVSMMLIFFLGTLLIILPVNVVNTLRSDGLIVMFNMAESDHILSAELLFNPNEDNRAKVEERFSEVRELFAENGMDVEVFQEILFRTHVTKGNQRTTSLSAQGMGDVTTDRYAYLKGTPPQNAGEVALTHLTAGQIGAEIGDDVKIKVGEETKTYTVTAIYQSMSNMGEGVRFHQDAALDYDYAAGCFGLQVNYGDDPDKTALAERKALLQERYPDADIYTPGEYISYMIGDVAEQLDSVEVLILSLILGINGLVAVLMVKSFLAREKGEVALLKAIGFQNGSLTLWQTLRIGLVLIVSVLLGVLSSLPLSPVIITPIFRMMGAYSIKYDIRGVEVYLIYPLILLAVTAFAAFLSAQGVRKVACTEVSNNE